MARTQGAAHRILNVTVVMLAAAAAVFPAAAAPPSDSVREAAPAGQGALQPDGSSRADHAAETALGKAFSALVEDSTALIAQASGRAGGELDFAVTLAAEIPQPLAFFAEPHQAVVSAGLIRALPDAESWFALLARLEAMDETAGKPGKRRRFTVKAVPPPDALYRGGSNDPNQQIVRRSTEAAIETLRRRRLSGMTPEEWREEQQRIDAEAIEILRKLGLDADALIRLYEAVDKAGGVTLESADPAWRAEMAEHLSWLRRHVGPKRRRPEAVAALEPRLEAVQEALRNGS